MKNKAQDDDYVKELESYVEYLEKQLKDAEKNIKMMQPIYLKYTNKILDSEKRVEIPDGKIRIDHRGIKNPFWT